jgi:hypothetical protein
MALRTVLLQFLKQIKTVRNSLILTTTSQQVLLAAGASHIYRDLTFLHANNTSGSQVLLDVSDGKMVYSWWLPSHGGGFDINFVPPLSASSPGTAWTVTISMAAVDVRVSTQAVETT